MEESVSPAVTWLIRQGQSAANAGLPVAGHDDVPLTALGVEQATAEAQRVDRPPALLVVSPFLRSLATAEPILAHWPATSLKDSALGASR
jgi:probable phosphoglycerate mutase